MLSHHNPLGRYLKTIWQRFLCIYITGHQAGKLTLWHRSTPDFPKVSCASPVVGVVVPIRSLCVLVGCPALALKVDMEKSQTSKKPEKNERDQNQHDRCNLIA
eukprot:scaffold649_cov347-Pavlova_lutheri.AAC.37